MDFLDTYFTKKMYSAQTPGAYCFYRFCTIIVIPLLFCVFLLSMFALTFLPLISAVELDKPEYFFVYLIHVSVGLWFFHRSCKKSWETEQEIIKKRWD